MSKYTWRELERAAVDAAAAHAFEIEHRAEQGIMSDEINAPRHYTGNGIECLDAMRSAMHGADVTPFEGFLWGAAFKYVWRWPFKNGRKDLEKAKRCIEILLKEIDTEVNTDLLPCQNVRIEGEVLTACGEEKVVEQ